MKALLLKAVKNEVNSYNLVVIKVVIDAKARNP